MTEKQEDTVDELVSQWADEHPTLDVSALAVVVRLQHLGKLFGARANRALRAHGLKHWEYDVLSVLRRQGAPFELPASELARRAHRSSGAMTTRIDGLEARGLVARRASREDGRSVLIRLTARGRRLIEQALATRLADADEALRELPAAERQRLSESLRHLLLLFEQTA